MRRWTLGRTMAAAGMFLMLALRSFAQSPPNVNPGPSNIGGLLFASNFGQWTVTQGNVGQYSWSAASYCLVHGGGTQFVAFTVGTPVQLVDMQNPGMSETVTPTSVTIVPSSPTSAGSCAISIAPVNGHNQFYFETATGGMQEALDWALTQDPQVSQVVLTPDWTTLGGQTAMIAAAQGSANITLIDERLACFVAYYVVTGVYTSQGNSCSGNAGTITGSGTAGQLAIFTSTSAIGNAPLDYSVSNVGDFTFGAPIFQPTIYNPTIAVPPLGSTSTIFLSGVAGGQLTAYSGGINLGSNAGATCLAAGDANFGIACATNGALVMQLVSNGNTLGVNLQPSVDTSGYKNVTAAPVGLMAQNGTVAITGISISGTTATISVSGTPSAPVAFPSGALITLNGTTPACLSNDRSSGSVYAVLSTGATSTSFNVTARGGCTGSGSAGGVVYGAIAGSMWWDTTALPNSLIHFTTAGNGVVAHDLFTLGNPGASFFVPVSVADAGCPGCGGATSLQFGTLPGTIALAGDSALWANTSTSALELNNNNAGWTYVASVPITGVTTGHCPQFGSAPGTFTDSGAACGGSGGPPSGAAGGDLSGTYPNPGVAQVNGAAVPASATLVGTNSSRQFVLQSGTITNNTSGTASNLSGTPALPNGTTATTQAPGDNTTDLATDAFVLANVSRAIAPLGTIPLNAFTGLDTFGDSVCTNAGADIPEDGWCSIISDTAGMGTVTQYGFSGDQLADTIMQRMLPNLAQPDSAAQAVTIALGINDANQAYSGNANQLVFENQLRLLAYTYAAMPYGKIVHADSTPLITTAGGTWTLGSTGLFKSLNTSTTSATVSTSVTTVGAAPIIVAYEVWSGDTGTMSVTVDGSLATDTITSSSTLSNGPFSGATLNTANGTAASFVGGRFVPSGAGTHTVVFTCVTAGTHGCTFGAAYSPATGSVYQPPVVAIVGVPFQNSNANSTNTASYDAANLAAAAAYKIDGANIYSVNIRGTAGGLPAINSTTDMGTGANLSGLTVTDAAMSSVSSTTTLTTSEAAFAAGDIGKHVVVVGAGSGGSNLNAVIQAVASSSSVTVSNPALTTVSAATAYIGYIGQVAPNTTNLGIHPNSAGHLKIANDVLYVLNPTTASIKQMGGPTPSNIGNLGAFPTAGNGTSLTGLNQGWCGLNTGANFFCHVVTGSPGASGVLSYALAYPAGSGANFSIYPNATAFAQNLTALNASYLDIQATNGLSLCGHWFGFSQVANATCTVEVAQTGAATVSGNFAMHTVKRRSSYYNGSTASTGLITETFGSTSAGTNLVQDWLFTASGCPTGTGCVTEWTGFTNFQIDGPFKLNGTTATGTFQATLTSSYAAAASTYGFSFTGALLTGGSGTTTFPTLAFVQGGTAETGWSTSGTYIGINAGSAFAGNFEDYHINNGASLWKITSAGAASMASTLTAGGTVTTTGTSPFNYVTTNTTAATSGACSVGGGWLTNGTYWTGAASAANTISFTPTCTVGTNGAETLTAANTGSTGLFTFAVTGNVTSTGAVSGATYATATKCANGASPAVCAAAAGGAVAIPTGVNPSLVVDTTAVSGSSQITLTVDDSVTIGGTTCNSTLASLVGGIAITARTPGTSFTVSYNGTITTNPVCLVYSITN